jgi:GTP-sensing pleiotropic transcriptional regulator CodY|tara:strand:- start:2009 stop:2314 length:306 start_codon:yes stop_codon:yes gene_type:complete
MNDPVKTKFHYDHSTDNVVLESIQDVKPLLELNKKELNNDSTYGPQLNNGMRKVASIPLVIIEKWKRELGVDIYNKNDWPKIKQLLNDSDNRFLRTHESQL